MKYLKQLLIICFIALLGELLNYLIPLPVPGSIYGLLILFLALNCKVIRVDQIRETARFLLEIMPIMFVAPVTKLITSWELVKGVLVPGVVICFLTTAAGMILVGRVTQAIIRRNHTGKEEH